MTASYSRRAFTLVELLVVTGLIAGLFGLVVTSLRPNASSQVRQLSQTLSSAILATQTRALGNETGAAIILDVAPGSAFSNSIFNADVPPFIVGTVTAGVPPASLIATTTTGTLSPTNADASDLAYGYRIQFLSTDPATPPSSWMGFSSSGTGASGTIRFQTAANQTIYNTVWPTNPSGASLRFQIARFPSKSTSALDATRLAAVDLRYSGIGNTVSGNYGTLNAKGPIAITFDRNGGLDTVMQYGSGSTPTVDPINPTAPLYLLIASLADIQGNTSLQSTTSRWLAIAPNTGRSTVAANVAVSGTLENDVFVARANARQGVSGGIK